MSNLVNWRKLLPVPQKDLKTPCIFFTGLIKYKGNLLASYGAADENVGIIEINFEELMKLLENC